jgi:hypothetical protein
MDIQLTLDLWPLICAGGCIAVIIIVGFVVVVAAVANKLRNK